jgi:hypothetical protein
MSTARVNNLETLDGATVVAVSDIATQAPITLTQLRALPRATRAKVVQVVGTTAEADGFKALYRALVGDTTTPASGIDIIVATDGGRWARIDSGANTGKHYAEQGAVINRMGDRLFVGGATKNLGTNQGSQPDWLTVQLLALGRTFAFQQVTQAAVLTGDDAAAGNAILGGARTSKFNYSGNAIGVLGVGINDNTNAAYFTGAYGGYFEGFALPGCTGPTYGTEIDAVNLAGLSVTDPYMQGDKQVNGLQIAAGAEFAAGFDCSAGLNFRGNGKSFQRGIVFGKDAISGTDGSTGTGLAITFAKGHSMQWYAGANAPTSAILCVGTNTADALTLQFQDRAMLVKDSAQATAFVAASVANAVNYLSVRNSVAGTPVQLIAAGTDVNRDIQMVPGGAGNVWLGAYTAGALTASGYITVKDSAGNLRRLMVG